jgi:hypothetical protein
MRWQISGSKIAGLLLIAVAPVVAILVCSIGSSVGIAAEPANVSKATPRILKLQLVAPDGKPVPHAEVSFRNTPAVKPEQVKVGEFVRADKYSARIKTDGSGKLVVKLTKIANYFAIDIEVPGYGPYWAQWRSKERAEDLPEKFVAELDAGWSVGGIITDSEGNPIKGAKIHPSIEFKKRPGDESQLGLGTEVKTGEDGKWHFDSVPISMNAVSVSIKHPQFMPEGRNLARSEYGLNKGTEPSAKILLKPGIVITGHVTDEAGKPIAEARVFTRDREAKTSKEGTYRLAGLGPGKVRVVVAAKARAMDMRDLNVEPNMEPVDFVLKPGGKIRIRVLNKEGQPLPKTRVFFQQWRGRQVEYFEFDKIPQYANKDGVWEWDGAPLDALEADICPPNGMQLVRQNITAREQEYVFHPLAALVISGQIISRHSRQPLWPGATLLESK